jgi:hypothetical protein
MAHQLFQSPQVAAANICGSLNINNGGRRFTESSHRNIPICTAPADGHVQIVRNDILNSLKEFRLEDGGLRVALVGPLGCGSVMLIPSFLSFHLINFSKSKKANYFAHEIYRAQQGLWVFWVDARNRDTIVQSYEAIALALRPHHGEMSEKRMVRKVRMWLQNAVGGGC